ncbi:putative 5-formyltetrahydrofolate cyclo-ligase [Grifola frondosa]|uniref:5-formyltetrahydrofolate cyclo-ligase n=1 Tax=Grifola frondosa TaxID=5627 RepID=A0A1C7LTY5_GRIFR|nr:putative 5-formyltetrahydrofolate cyclo-ligase [Grifola frondosa]
MAASLRALSSAEIATQSQEITRRVLSSPFFLRSKNVSCYLNMPSGEVDTSELVSEILRAGKTLFVPKMNTKGDGTMDFFQVHGEEDLRSFPSGLWGIKEPNYERGGKRRASALESAASDQLDLILLPGVAFDKSLSRLGHGKGYYDRFISEYTSPTIGNKGKPLLVALALREQILEAGQVPTVLHDWKMDVIVGPDGILCREEFAE